MERKKSSAADISREVRGWLKLAGLVVIGVVTGVAIKRSVTEVVAEQQRSGAATEAPTPVETPAE